MNLTKFGAMAIAGAGLLFASSALADTSLAVTGAAALNSTNYGLAVTMDGGTSPAYVQDNSPAAETTYRARFWLDVNDMTTAGTTRQQHMIFNGFTASAGSPPPVFRTWLLREGGTGKWRVRVWCRPNNPPFTKGTPITLGTAGAEPPRLIEVNWNAATGPATGDGGCSIQRFGGADPIETISGLQNDALDVRRVRLGAISSLDSPTTGTYYLDEFSSFR